MLKKIVHHRVMTKDQAAGPANLFDGYRKFRESTYPQYKALYDRLSTHGQRPRTMVIACADSRVDPGTIVSAAPGELFVTRSVANIVPPYAPGRDFHSTEAGLEFAVCTLEVENLVVMGHGQCGGITALLDGLHQTKATEFVGPWIKVAAEARERVVKRLGDAPREKLQLALEEENIRLGLSQLMTSPWIAEKVPAGKLPLHGRH